MGKLRFSERYHLFEWLVNVLLVAGPVLLISYGLLTPDGWVDVILGLVFMVPISLGCLIFYGWLYQQAQPRQLAGYQWWIVAGYVISFIISGAIMVATWQLH
ncbi:hypothetical protein LXEBMM8_EKPBGFGD_02706 [Lactiplantibacillus xiangfangensis]